MKKSIKICLIILTIFIIVILIDTAQAKIFNNRPIIKITENYNGGNIYQKDSGIFVYTYIFSSGTKKTVFRWEKYAPLVDIQKDNNKFDNPVSNENSNKEVDEIMEDVINIKVNINNKIYNATIENNETAKEFISRLPQEYSLKEKFIKIKPK